MTAPTASSSSASDRRFRIIVGIGLVVVAGMLWLAVHLTNTKDATPVTVQSRPDVVEHVIPVDGSSEPRQAEFGVDLAPGYDGTLVVNGTEIPRDELRLVPAQNEVFFTPGKDKIIDDVSGLVNVTAIVWKTSVGRGPQDQRFQWSFTAL